MNLDFRNNMMEAVGECQPIPPGVGVVHTSESCLVRTAPSSIHYIPNFVTEEEESSLLARIYSAPKPKWQHLSNRRLQNWGGIVGKRALVPDNNMPQWLSGCIDKVQSIPFAFPDHRPNHVLINEYEPGQGIMPHTDGPAFFPTVTTISLGSHTLLDFYRPIDEDSSQSLNDRFVGSMLLEPRSLVVIQDDAYRTLLHGICERTKDDLNSTSQILFNQERVKNLKVDFESEDGKGDKKVKKRGTRVSLTIRNVPKVASLNLTAVNSFRRS